MNQSTIPICQLCKDPIWSYICPQCLAEDISKWLPEAHSGPFNKFHKTFEKFFEPNLDTTFLNCVHCKSSAPASICPFCYILEAFNWLKPKAPELAEQLFKMLPLAKDWVVTEHSGCMWKEGFRPMEEQEDKKQEFGFCDECGEYTDELVLLNGSWVCSECGSL
ncbi:MAG: hypothetical protein ABIJ92_04765 [Candidatus Aenigmatarchaeota archaeon]